MLNFENSLIFQIEQFRIIDHFLNQAIIAIWKMANFSNYTFWKFSELDIFGIQFFFKFVKLSKFQKLANFGIVRPFDIPHHSQFCRFSYINLI